MINVLSTQNICREKTRFWFAIRFCEKIYESISKSCQKYLPQPYTFWTGILIMLILRKRTKWFHCSFLWRKWFCCFFRVKTFLAKSVIYNLGSTGFFQNILFRIHRWFHFVEPHDPWRDINHTDIWSKL